MPRGAVRFYYDAEFIEDGRTIDLVSIGIVAEDGREFYAVSSEFDVAALHRNPWLVENVWPSLPSRWPRVGILPELDRDHPDVRPRARIARAVREFLVGNHPTQLRHVELWADYGAYDHVALCQLWGRMIDLPEGIPMWTNDLRQEAERLGLTKQLPEQSDGLHNALADARHARALGGFLGHSVTVPDS